MVALLGLLAVAGFQNRDKLGGLLNSLGGQQDPNNPNRQVGGGLGDMLGGALGGTAAGGALSGGLGDLVDRFRQAGHGDKADSWVNPGDNTPVNPSDLEQTLGEDTITELTQKTGLSRSDLLERLAKTLPDAVNQMTPNGRLPTADEAQHLMG
ncbi:MAG TPA: YidB family protein [Devosia sp.]|nr:YidB family protein [Devosia sp.]